jgi:hypothetical protein
MGFFVFNRFYLMLELLFFHIWLNLCTLASMKKLNYLVVCVIVIGQTLSAQPRGGSFPKIEKPSVNISKPNINLNSPGKAVFGSGSNTSRPTTSGSGSVNITRSARSQFGSGSNSSNSGAGYTPRTYTPSTYTPRSNSGNVNITRSARSQFGSGNNSSNSSSDVGYTPRAYYPPVPSYYYNPYASPYGIYYRNNYYRTFYNSSNYYNRSNATNNASDQSMANTLHAQKVELSSDLSIRSWILKSGVWDTLARIKPIVQEFVISRAEESFEIKTTGGITFKFPANSLVDAYGNSISGKVKFNITELSKFSDFGTAGFSSSTTSGEMLESGGMVDIRAFNGKDNSNELSLADGKQFTINGNSSFKDGFQTFYGQRGEQVSWTTDPNQVQSSNNSEKNEGDKKYTLSIFPVLAYAEDGKSYPLVMGTDINGNEVRDMQFIDWFNETVKVPKDLRKSIKKGGIHFPVTLYFNENGDIIDAVLADSKQASEGLVAPYFNEIKNTLLTAKGLLFANKSKVPSTLTIRLVTVEKSAYPSMIPAATKLPISAPLNSMATSNDAGNWVLQSSSLKLVNCDRFVSVPKASDTIKYEIPRGDALIYYAFYDYNALLKPNVNEITNTGYNYGLTQYAKNAKIRVIAIVYGDDGKVHLEVAENKDGSNKLGAKMVLPFNRYTAKAAFDLQPIDGFF